METKLICNTCQKKIDKKLYGTCYCSIKCRHKDRERKRKYRLTDSYKKSQKKYRQSDKYKKYREAYCQSDKFKKSRRKYLKSAKCKESRRKYHQLDIYKASQRKYYQSEKYKTNVYPHLAIKDYLKRVEVIKFHSPEEVEQDILNYSKTVCSIQGNCKDISERIKKTKEIKKLLKYQKMIN